MTGFGNASVENPDVFVEATIKSVNSRFFECRCHLPREFYRWEEDIRNVIKRHVRRGSVDVYIHRRKQKELEQKVIVHENNAKLWMKSLERIQRSAGLKMDVNVFQLSQLPGVTEVIVQDKAMEKEKELLVKLLHQTCQQLNNKRKKEGDALKRTISNQLKTLEGISASIRELFKKIKLENNKKRQSQVESDTGAAADKADITEELDRLDQHYRIVRSILAKDVDAGKQLDFYCQELLREVNTIGSKSQNAKLTENVVLAKSTIEQIREQVQNVE